MKVNYLFQNYLFYTKHVNFNMLKSPAPGLFLPRPRGPGPGRCPGWSLLSGSHLANNRLHFCKSVFKTSLHWHQCCCQLLLEFAEFLFEGSQGIDAWQTSCTVEAKSRLLLYCRICLIFSPSSTISVDPQVRKVTLQSILIVINVFFATDTRIGNWFVCSFGGFCHAQVYDPWSGIQSLAQGQ